MAGVQKPCAGSEAVNEAGGSAEDGLLLLLASCTGSAAEAIAEAAERARSAVAAAAPTPASSNLNPNPAGGKNRCGVLVGEGVAGEVDAAAAEGVVGRAGGM